MKNKGFTLIELLGTILIISVLAFLTFPSIINFIYSKSDDISKMTSVLLDEALDAYLDEHKTEESNFCIPLIDLVENGNIKRPIILSINGEDVTDTMSLKVSRSDKISYEIVDNDKCN